MPLCIKIWASQEPDTQDLHVYHSPSWRGNDVWLSPISHLIKISLATIYHVRLKFQLQSMYGLTTKYVWIQKDAYIMIRSPSTLKLRVNKVLMKNNTCVLPIPAGPTNSVKTPNGIPPHKASSNPFRRVGRWPAKCSFWTRCSIRDNA